MVFTSNTQNFDNDSYETDFSYNTLTGLIDSDGTYYSRIRPGTGADLTMKHEISVKFDQQKPNEDLAYSLRAKLGGEKIGPIHTNPGQGTAGPKAHFVAAFSTLEREGLDKKWLEKFPPLIPEKRRDYLIACLIRDFQRNDYLSFDALENSLDLEGQQLKIEFNRIPARERRKAGSVACIYLRANTSPSLQKILNEEEVKPNDELIRHLEPLQSTEIFGKKLSDYFLLAINKEQKDLEDMLLDKNYVLPDDYFVGLFMGDGSLQFKLKFTTRCEYSYTMTITLNENSESMLKAVQNKFQGKGRIRAVGVSGKGRQYVLDSHPVLREQVIPFFNNFKMSKSKQREFEIIKELFTITDNKGYRTKEGAFRMVDLWTELSTLHKKPRRTSSEQMKHNALLYLQHNRYV